MNNYFAVVVDVIGGEKFYLNNYGAKTRYVDNARQFATAEAAMDCAVSGAEALGVVEVSISPFSVGLIEGVRRFP